MYAHILYDNFVPQINRIGSEMESIQERLKKHLKNESLLVPLTSIRQSNGELNVSLVVETAILKTVTDLAASDNLNRQQWKIYYEAYLVRRQAVGGKKRHAGERTTWFDDETVVAVEDIARLLRKHQAPVQQMFSGKSINRKLIVALALLYTEDAITAFHKKA